MRSKKGDARGCNKYINTLMTPFLEILRTRTVRLGFTTPSLPDLLNISSTLVQT